MVKQRLSQSWCRTGLLCFSLACLVMFGSTGCMRSWVNDFLDPSEVGRFHGKPVTNEIRATLGLLDEETEAIAATDPLPEDRVVVPQEYRMGPGDVVEVTIHELIAAGAIASETRRISELGYINLPILKRVHIAGLTVANAEERIADLLEERGILPDPIVAVVLREERQRFFHIVGFISRQGAIPIPRSDFRMLEALSYAGSLPEEVEKVYVIRNPSVESTPSESTLEEAVNPPTAPTTSETLLPERPSATKPTTAPDPTKSRASGILREDVDILLGQMDTDGKPSTGTITREERRELLEAILPGRHDGQTASARLAQNNAADKPADADADASKSLSKWVWVGGEWVEVKGDTAQQEPPGPGEPSTTTTTAPTVPDTTQKPDASLEWEAVADAGDETRVIGIPVKALQSGEMRYNIVIRPGDVISIPTPEAGRRYYVAGHVRGAGAYTIPPEGIRITAAIASAGGLDPYAWPSRCEIARRIGPDQEQIFQINLDRIFAGKDQNILIKPGDVINVGTHPLSPFLVTIANGFRATYGFGFVYDRNFGTIDSFGPQQNPRDRRRAEKASRFPALQAAFPGL